MGDNNERTMCDGCDRTAQCATVEVRCGLALETMYLCDGCSSALKRELRHGCFMTVTRAVVAATTARIKERLRERT